MTLDNNIFNDVFLYSPYNSVSNMPQTSKLLVPLDGIQSGVPTRTTATLTPTTLRNIEQTLIDWSNEVDRPVSTPCQAGFVPPLIPGQFTDSNDNNSIESSESGSQTSWHIPIMQDENSALTDTSSVATLFHASNSPSLPVATNTANSLPATIGGVSGIHTGNIFTTNLTSITKTTNNRRSTGGRRPTKPSNLTPEEEEKRRIRRERNKLAAARCRKRRVDQTNELIEKVEQLEHEKQGIQQKIEELKMTIDELELCLQTHQPSCLKLAQTRLTPASTIAALPTVGATTESGITVPVTGRCVVVSSIDTNNIKTELITNNDFELKNIKTEPLDTMVDSLDGPPSPKRLMLASNNPVIPPPLPNVSTIGSTIAIAASVLNTPTITTPPIITTKPNRPSSLNVPLIITPSQALGITKTVTDITGVPITTPSSGVTFNFDSLMDGGTGLTPVAAPLMPTCSSQNKHPLDLATPTSEPSKLVSL